MFILPAALLIKIGIGAAVFVGASVYYAYAIEPDIGDLGKEKKKKS